MSSFARHMTLGLLIAGLSFSAFAVAPDAMLRQNVDKILASLSDTSLDKDQRWEIIRTTTENSFDVELMGKLVVGRDNWMSFNEAQQKSYIDTFRRILLQAYSDQLENYAGERLEFGNATIEGSKASVDSVMISKERRLPLVYKLRQQGDEWLVYDIVIDGVSILKTYRTQYNDYLKQKSVDAFLEMLKGKAAE